MGDVPTPAGDKDISFGWCSRLKLCACREFELSMKDKEMKCALSDDYFTKCLSPFEGPPRREHPWKIFFSWVGSFVGIAFVAILHYYLWFPLDLHGIFGSMGATAVLLYAAPNAPLAQPRNCIVGHTISAIWGVSCYKISALIAVNPHNIQWLTASTSVSISIVLMHFTKSMHPPGGATSLIAVISPTVIAMGYYYVLLVVIDAIVMLLVAFVVDNIPNYGKYPNYWV